MIALLFLAAAIAAGLLGLSGFLTGALLWAAWISCAVFLACFFASAIMKNTGPT